MPVVCLRHALSNTEMCLWYTQVRHRRGLEAEDTRQGILLSLSIRAAFNGHETATNAAPDCAQNQYNAIYTTDRGNYSGGK